MPEFPLGPEQEIGPNAIAYTIKKGGHYSIRNSFKTLSTDQIRFSVTFDSTAIYTTKNPANQGDINKLYGLADCNSLHQVNSVRFGWRWYGNRLEVLAYTYKNRARNYAFVGYATLGQPSTCEIRLEDQAYILTMDGRSVTLPRECDGVGQGYRLYPYFGGDEVAPHDITISIQQLL
ncbi:hypothetical protein SAMN06296052_1083 [Pontibacter ummariensis]|uniref:Uncharacterized protein n=1 Tax=Pontibacter ummariensis TaxID=1610492 RepID=A0A239F425_9BACT|nr:hypothetical protein SAMN06296052_1083 [Pontibacter ummariensis]